MSQERFIKCLNRLSLFIAFLTLCAGIYIAVNGLGLINGLDFGPGAYYYTDIPNWPKIFLGEQTINLGFQSPILAALFFFAWGFICFKIWKWLDEKMK